MYAAQPANGRRPAAHSADPADDIDARLNWYSAAVAETERCARLVRTRREQRELELMRRPVSSERAFALFGLLLGTLPPAAIFFRMLYVSVGLLGAGSFLFVTMLGICALVGWRMGARVGRTVDESERRTWAGATIDALEAGFVWAAATGAAGGFLFFGVGALFGVACALAVALPAFAVFTSLHRLLARGGMIDARHLRPLAWGVSTIAAALILSPYLLPY